MLINWLLKHYIICKQFWCTFLNTYLLFIDWITKHLISRYLKSFREKATGPHKTSSKIFQTRLEVLSLARQFFYKLHAFLALEKLIEISGFSTIKWWAYQIQLKCVFILILFLDCSERNDHFLTYYVPKVLRITFWCITESPYLCK